MERRPAESKRSPRDKAKKEPVEEEEKEEVAAGGGVDEDKKRRTSSCSSTAVAAGGGVGVGGASGASSVGAGVMVGRRGSGGGVTQPSCQAERCTSDLTGAKRYHRRHKVCEAHSKAPVVIVAGLRQRFCQQCSRFHELSEFDEAKRSCRRRLAGHNERRRKSSSESQADGSNCCSQADQGGRMQISLPGNPTYKHFQIR